MEQGFRPPTWVDTVEMNAELTPGNPQALHGRRVSVCRPVHQSRRCKGPAGVALFTDLSGFSGRVAEFGIIHFLQTIFESQRILVPCIDLHDGILLKSEGDSLLVIFRSVRKALDSSLSMQKTVHEYNRGREDTDRILLCVGIGFDRVLRIGDDDVFGAEVNAAAKLGEDTARSGDILVTGAVAEAGAEVPGLSFTGIDTVPPGADRAFRVVYPE